MNKNNQKSKDGNWQISFSPIFRYVAIFCLLIFATIMLGGAVLSFSQMKSNAQVLLSNVHAQTSQRIDESITQLESLASLPEFYDPNVPVSYTHLTLPTN